MRLVLEIDEVSIRERLAELNDERRQSGLSRVLLRDLKAWLKDTDRLTELAEEQIDEALETLG